MQPMFKIVPGFLQESSWMHGNDIITSGKGQNMIVADDISGASALDLSEVTYYVQDLRQRIDNLVKTIGKRLTTLQVDTEYYSDDSAMDYNVTVGSDTITTDIDGQSFVTRDSMTLLGRSVLAGSLTGSPFPTTRSSRQLLQILSQ
jgi:hypothetical protein